MGTSSRRVLCSSCGKTGEVGEDITYRTTPQTTRGKAVKAWLHEECYRRLVRRLGY